MGLALAAPRVARAQESHVDGDRAATKAHATDPAAALTLGRALRRAGHPVEALAELRRGIGVSAGKLDVLVSLHWEIARVQMDRRDFVQTMTTCQVLGKLPGAAAEGHACTADAHLLQQRSTAALEETAAALSRDPRCFEAKVAEGRAEEFALDTPKSEAAYRAAIALRPDVEEPRVGLGRLLWRGGRKDDGIAELRHAVQVDPDGPEGLYELGLALAPGTESVGLLEHATRERPAFTEAWLALGEQLLAAGRIADARKAAVAAERGDPSSVAAKVLVGKVALAEGHADEAVRAGEAALKIVANSAAAKLLVADGNASKGEIDRALEAYQAAWGLDHGDPTPLVHATEACHAAGRDTSAKAFGLKAVQEFPRWGPAWAALGDALVAQGEKAAAKDAYRKALAGEGPVARDVVQKKLSGLP
ncbi:MAG TPA: tetratricopeptide repeat protein [Polyangiaceae bacterium]|nr:tetratricopeptide repeat protein [Polyangiaceae bacterium]